VIKDTLTTTALLGASALGTPEVDGTYLLMFLGVIWMFIQLVLGLLALKSRIFPSPNPPLHAEYATKTELSEVKNNVNKLEAEMRQNFKELNNQGEQRAYKLHARINEVLAAVSRLGGKIEGKDDE